ncbi:TetR/AcrR family transcriptional regulator [Pseudonocardia lacus]|jgi:AcrR family transcriptional regulator|uniref:TetR/AcrR family transcriptional regulator n=1 Tax=Pseudonocardia lacus TaxID=2835865 RepID=UPI001BDDA071|nr:TetR/AcrR family transcriptional regulator [Pseudonocardia lacus]
MRGTAQRIADTARALLAAEGAAAVSMRRIAATIGVTPMALYRHYPNRDALLAAVADQAFTDLARRWKERPATGGDAVAQLHAAFDALLDVAIDEPHLYRFLFTDTRARARTYPDDFRDGASPTLAVVADIVRTGIDARLLREDDVWDVAFTIAAHMQGLILLFQGGRTDPSADRFRAMCHGSLGRILDGLTA